MHRRTASALAFCVGFWSLAGQFILNRIIFFYVANSEYVAATIISLHLFGFLLGSLAARRYVVPVPSVVGMSLLATACAQFLLWTLGLAFLGLVLTLVLAIGFAILFAFLSGYIVIRLIEERGAAASTPIIVADSAGSVAGALLGGFIFIPVFGLQISFAILAALQATALIALSIRDRTRIASTAILIVLAAFLIFPYRQKQQLITVEGLPLPLKQENYTKLYEHRSPFGILSVTDTGEKLRELRVDNRILCSVYPESEKNEALSEWLVGKFPSRNLESSSRVAMIGLGCGISLAAILAEVPQDVRVDAIEINPDMSAAQELFRERLPLDPDDPRVTLTVEDGFRYFAEDIDKYDAVVMDLAWMHNMNATHLFSREMFQNVSNHMTETAVFGVWSEEFNPFSPVSLIMYRTLLSVFPHVYVDADHGAVLFFASKSDFTPTSERGASLSEWMNAASEASPLNTLDSLVMNRYKFTLTGDSTFDQLDVQYLNIFH